MKCWKCNDTGEYTVARVTRRGLWWGQKKPCNAWRCPLAQKHQVTQAIDQ